MVGEKSIYLLAFQTFKKIQENFHQSNILCRRYSMMLCLKKSNIYAEQSCHDILLKHYDYLQSQHSVKYYLYPIIFNTHHRQQSNISDIWKKTPGVLNCHFLVKMQKKIPYGTITTK